MTKERFKPVAGAKKSKSIDSWLIARHIANAEKAGKKEYANCLNNCLGETEKLRKKELESSGGLTFAVSMDCIIY